MVGFTRRQIERPKLSRKTYSNIWLPNINNVKHMVSTNMIPNCPVSVADISSNEKYMVHQWQVSKASQQVGGPWGGSFLPSYW